MLMRLAGFFFMGVSMLANQCAALDEPYPTTPAQSLQRLMAGNRRYVENKLLHPNRTQESREAVAEQQAPFAIVLGCSDSRVSPEIVFDQGIGDLFVVRVAGNVAGAIELDSIEFSAVYLGSSLILVLGHQRCGAVKAVLENKTADIEAVANLIEPSVRAVKGKAGDPLENAIKANIKEMVKTIKTSPVIAKLIQQKKLEVAGGYYHLETGEVELLK